MTVSPQRRAAVLVAVVAGGLVAAWMIFHDAERSTSPPAAALKGLQVPSADLEADEGGLRPLVREILDPATPVAKRFDLLRSCPVDLSEAEIQALLGEVSTSSQAPGAVAEYSHGISLLLRKVPAARERLARVLAGVARDPARPTVFRDYAIQHMRRLWQFAKEDAPLRQGLLQSFRELSGGDAAVAGPALLSLHILGDKLETRGGELPDGELQPVVSQVLAKSPDAAGHATTIAALRITGDRKLHELAPRVKEIAADASIHAVVRMAAISVIASLETPAPIAFLESLDRRDPKVNEAVQIALQRSRP